VNEENVYRKGSEGQNSRENEENVYRKCSVKQNHLISVVADIEMANSYNELVIFLFMGLLKGYPSHHVFLIFFLLKI
jgi:hypothetical protein